MQYLKPKQDYIDRYDRITVRECRWAENAITKDSLKDHYKKTTKKAELDRTAVAFNRLHLWFVQGERYKKKEETIARWMQEDEKKDAFFERTQPPSNITCHTCGREMFVSYKHLEDYYDDRPLRVLFMFDCPQGHLPRRAFYNNGEEWYREKPRCVKCTADVEEEAEITDTAYKTTLTCPNCKHVEVQEVEKVVIEEEKEDTSFEKDRARFCYGKDGEEYLAWMKTAEELNTFLDKKKEKEENKELYDRVAALKKLSIPQVKQFLTEVLENEPYTNLAFEQPSMDRVVSIGFSIEDPTDQGEYDSRTKLSRFLKKKLEETNWRLMSDGITYRLGVLTGRVRIYEKEEELVKLVENK